MTPACEQSQEHFRALLESQRDKSSLPRLPYDKRRFDMQLQVVDGRAMPAALHRAYTQGLELTLACVAYPMKSIALKQRRHLVVRRNGGEFESFKVSAFEARGFIENLKRSPDMAAQYFTHYLEKRIRHHA